MENNILELNSTPVDIPNNYLVLKTKNKIFKRLTIDTLDGESFTGKLIAFQGDYYEKINLKLGQDNNYYFSYLKKGMFDCIIFESTGYSVLSLCISNDLLKNNNWKITLDKGRSMSLRIIDEITLQPISNAWGD